MTSETTLDMLDILRGFPGEPSGVRGLAAAIGVRDKLLYAVASGSHHRIPLLTLEKIADAWKGKRYRGKVVTSKKLIGLWESAHAEYFE